MSVNPLQYFTNQNLDDEFEVVRSASVAPSNGPSTLSPLSNDQALALGSATSGANTADRAMLGTASRLAPPQSRFSPADQAMLGTAARIPGEGLTGLGPPGTVAPTAASPMESLLSSFDLSGLIEGISGDSQAAFSRLQTEAGARGAATQTGIREVNERIAAELGMVPEQVAGDGAGGLSATRLAGGAATGAQGVVDMQTALGGFLEGSQGRRTNAVQNFLTGLEGQAQVGIDQARTAGEFLLAQQQALIQQEQARVQNDIAAQAAQDQITQSLLESFGLPAIPGLTVPQALDVVGQARQGAQQGLGPLAGTAGGGGALPEGTVPGAGGQPYTPGAFGQDFLKAGFRPEVVQGFERLELSAGSFFSDPQALNKGLVDVEGNPTTEGINAFLGQNVIVTGENDPRVGKVTDLGGGRGQRLFITQDDYNKYLQWSQS